MRKIVLFALTIFLTMVIFITSITPASALALAQRQNLSILLDLRNSIIEDLVYDPLNIQKVMINNDNISITVDYPGGCNIHDFTLIGSRSFIETLPAQAYIKLSHNSNGDRCEAGFTDTLRFDLTPLKEQYLAAYKTEHGSIILTVVSGDQSRGNIEYNF